MDISKPKKEEPPQFYSYRPKLIGLKNMSKVLQSNDEVKSAVQVLDQTHRKRNKANLNVDTDHGVTKK